MSEAVDEPSISELSERLKSALKAPEKGQGRAKHPSRAPHEVELFLKASELERNGHVAQAIKLYEQAYRLNPDVDKIAGDHWGVRETFPLLQTTETGRTATSNKPKFQITVPGLLEELNRSHREYYRPLGLPREVMMQILAWVGIFHAPSLEECAKTCKRLFSLSRDDINIWRRLVFSTRASRLADLRPLIQIPPGMASYRQMYFDAPRLRTDGVYICKISYFRPGVTDGAFFQPIHMVTYYRYLRFFGATEGHQAILVVSTEEPKKIIPLLKSPVEDALVDDIPFGRLAVDLVPGYQRERRVPTIRLPIFKKANVFFGRYFRDDLEASKYQVTLYDPQSTHRSLFQMQLSVVAGKRNGVVVCDQYSSVSPPTHPEATPLIHDFDVADWGKLFFSRVRSYIS